MGIDMYCFSGGKGLRGRSARSAPGAERPDRSCSLNSSRRAITVNEGRQEEVIGALVLKLV
jgi:hypothetical protein